MRLPGSRTRNSARVSLDQALRIALFQHEAAAAVARLEADPDALADYQREAREWAELDVQVRE